MSVSQNRANILICDMRERPAGSALPFITAVSDMVKQYGSGSNTHEPIHKCTNRTKEQNMILLIELVSILLQIFGLGISIYILMKE
ncbi:hypothetical protein [Halococcoides cellulosivorans]|uniref:hypothetical protein n=1 Tax=Halococcoides cellulosivorans TaxID=1679096 RepID=UPI00131F3CE6|nr:hypothetical protein [Halococcoides cellulosivorans]